MSRRDWPDEEHAAGRNVYRVGARDLGPPHGLNRVAQGVTAPLPKEKRVIRIEQHTT